MRDSKVKNCPKTTHHLLGYRHRQGQWAPSLYCERSDAQIDCYLVHLFQDSSFFLSRSTTSHSPTAIVQHEFVTPSSILLAPLSSSPCLDANGGINLLAIRSSDWLTLRLPRENNAKGGTDRVPSDEGLVDSR